MTIDAADRRAAGHCARRARPASCSSPSTGSRCRASAACWRSRSANWSSASAGSRSEQFVEMLAVGQVLPGPERRQPGADDRRPLLRPARRARRRRRHAGCAAAAGAGAGRALRAFRRASRRSPARCAAWARSRPGWCIATALKLLAGAAQATRWAAASASASRARHLRRHRAAALAAGLGPARPRRHRRCALAWRRLR